MADRFSAQIWIGGQISRKMLVSSRCFARLHDGLLLHPFDAIVW